MEERTCGNCACWNQANELMGACTGDILKTGQLRDRREAAAECKFWKPRWKDEHLTMVRVVATSFGNDWKNPFDVRIYCSNGGVYQDGKDRVMQARCAGWKQEWREYIENGETYTENTWTGTGLPVVVTERQRVR